MPSSALSTSTPDVCAVTVTFSLGMTKVYVPPEPEHSVPLASTLSTPMKASELTVTVTVVPAVAENLSALKS